MRLSLYNNDRESTGFKQKLRTQKGVKDHLNTCIYLNMCLIYFPLLSHHKTASTL